MNPFDLFPLSCQISLGDLWKKKCMVNGLTRNESFFVDESFVYNMFVLYREELYSEKLTLVILSIRVMSKSLDIQRNARS